MDGHLKMGIGMPVDSQRLADVYLHAKFLAQLSAQAASGRLAEAALSPGKLPQAAQQAAFRAPADQDAPAAADDGGRRDSLRNRSALSPDWPQVLDAAAAGATSAADRADTTARVARQANLRPKVHQGLVEVGGVAARQMAARPSSETGLAFLRPRVDLEIGQARQDTP